MDVFAQNERLGRGVNIFGYDPGWSAPDRRRMQAAHFRQIREAGFSHVRIPLHPFGRMADAGDGCRIDEKWLAVVDWALGQALANNLMVILNCHEYHSMARDPEGLKPKWLAFWRRTAPRYASALDTVLFELLNEPNHALTPELWNAFLVEGLALVPESGRRRTAIVGPGERNSIGKLATLALPADDRHLLVTVHYYEPRTFTHRGAPFEGREGDVGHEWNATESGRRAIERDFQTAQRWADEHAGPILLGEFGAYDAGDMDSRAVDPIGGATGRVARLELVLLAVRRRFRCLQYRRRQVSRADSRRAHPSCSVSPGQRLRHQPVQGEAAPRSV